MVNQKNIEIDLKLLFALTGFYFCSVLLFGFMHDQTDTASYVNATQLFWGFEGDVDRLHRLVKPTALLIPGLLYTLFKLPIVYGMFFQQFCCYFGSGIVLYNIFVHLFDDKKRAFWASLLLLGCQPMAIYGTAYLVDGLGWFFGLSGILMGVRILLIEGLFDRQFLKVGAWVAVGFFAKESAAIAGLFLGIHILLNQDINWLRKLKIYTYLGSSFLLVVVAISLFTQLHFDKNMLTWIAFANTDPTYYSWKGCILQTFRTIDFYWFLVALGTIPFWQARSKKNPLLLHYILTGLVLLVLLPFVWPYTVDRILFMMSPFILALAACSFDLFKEKVAWIVCFGAILNLGITFGIYRYNLAGWLVKGSIIYTIFLGLLLFLEHRPK